MLAVGGDDLARPSLRGVSFGRPTIGGSASSSSPQTSSSSPRPRSIPVQPLSPWSSVMIV
jgi:hypothetical protein